MDTISRLSDEIAALEAMVCECELFGACWPCRQIARLRAALRNEAA